MALADNVPAGPFVAVDVAAPRTAWPDHDDQERREPLFFGREKTKCCGTPLEMVPTADLQHFNLEGPPT
ncbi:hypothetical protein H257_16377 [Aphanomyces astaci]|uniref:Uncharacterized protein n=1 Tax=Aphanomyces astaci TaxID=112090 RepID=W4FKN2_APHAT|nr:hypothetical protein H257_16377 [Aphanomyces astaci]ETV67399.1 hypothetical protein H257_16377 [Aphanomyces astaci]|eukprot:XP_009843090.1 hypothetical protein H257_16377 [Aphanomyces astaci]